LFPWLTDWHELVAHTDTSWIPATRQYNIHKSTIMCVHIQPFPTSMCINWEYKYVPKHTALYEEGDG
jgi:hypothetical protein